MHKYPDKKPDAQRNYESNFNAYKLQNGTLAAWLLQTSVFNS